MFSITNKVILKTANARQLPRNILAGLILIWVALAAMQVRWITIDTRPLACDPATHLRRAREYAQAFRTLSPRMLVHLWRAEYGNYTYPPLCHALLGAGLCVTRDNPAVATVLVNLGFLSVLLYSVTQIGRLAFSPGAGLGAAALVGSYNFVAHLQHEAYLDFALTAACAYCIWRLLLTRGFSLRGPSIVFGVAIGLALLIKHVTVIFLVGPVLFSLWHHRARWNRAVLRNLVAAGIVMLAIAMPWYAIHLKVMLATFKFNQAISVKEGDPMPFTLAGATYYLNAMVSTQMGFALFLLAAIAIGCWIWWAWKANTRKDGAWSPGSAEMRGIIVAWLLTSYLVLTFIMKNKDERYSVPMLPAVALLTCAPAGFAIRPVLRRAWLALVALAAFPFYSAAMLNWPAAGKEQSFMAAGAPWVLWSEDFLHGPRHEDWHVLEMLKAADSQRPASHNTPLVLGSIPFLERYCAPTFMLESVRHHLNIECAALGELPTSALLTCDLVLCKTGDQGIDFAVPAATELNNHVLSNPERFSAVEKWDLPDGSAATLYRVIH